MNPTTDKKLGFYFSLPRIVAMLFGGNPQRSESNGFEAVLVGVWVYLIHLLYFAIKFIPHLPTRFLAPLLLIVIAIAIWPFWLLVLYLNALLIKLLRHFGLFQTIPNRRAQNILFGIYTTLMAGSVFAVHPWLWQLSAAWLLAVVLNLIAGLVLSYSDATRGFDE